MKTLRISERFTLPLEAVTETFLDLGQRGSGKTNTAAVIAEELYAHGAPFAVLTPIDVWWGLKSSADGKGPGLPIYTFGGGHADLPLQPTAGKLMADVLIEERISCVICTTGFSGKERAMFVTDLAERLLSKNRQPLHLIVEEADAFIPQRPYPGEERMLGAMDRLIRWGRSPSAIGGTFISQRSAKINKDITTQCSVLLAHRTVAPQDIEAIKEWFRYHPDTEKQRQLLAEISSLPKGCTFIFSPAWLDFFGKVQIRRRNTFDSAATPKLGESVMDPKTASVDLKVLEAKMSETIERAKADDPKELKRRIRELESASELKPSAESIKEAKSHAYEVGYREGQAVAGVQLQTMREIIDNAFQLTSKAAKEIQDIVCDAADMINRKCATPIDISGLLTTADDPNKSVPIYQPYRPPEAPVPQPQSTILFLNEKHEQHVPKLKAGCRDILRSLAGFHPDPMTRGQIAMLCGIKSTGSTMSSYLSNLRTANLIAEQGDSIRLTPDGVGYFNGDMPKRLRTGAEMVAMWSERLKKGAREILEELFRRHPDGRTRAQLCSVLDGINPDGSTISSYLSNLRTCGLISEVGDRIYAHENLFKTSGRRP